jgi:glycine cleavage system transcriptional repressor
VRHFALSALGRDRPGIVAAISAVLLEHGLNIEDSQMTILSGHFTMMLIVASPDEVDEERLRADLERTGQVGGLEGVFLREIEDVRGRESVPTHIVSIYGVDHPGIVHAVSAALGERGVNITDLNTRLVAEDEPQPLYAMMLEVVLPPDLDGGELERLLRSVGEDQGVEVSVRPLEEAEL